MANNDQEKPFTTHVFDAALQLHDKMERDGKVEADGGSTQHGDGQPFKTDSFKDALAKNDEMDRKTDKKIDTPLPKPRINPANDYSEGDAREEGRMDKDEDVKDGDDKESPLARPDLTTPDKE